MPAPTSIDELLDLVRKSGVADEKRIEAHVQRLREEGQLPSDPTKCAAALVQAGLLTNFQAEQLVQGKWRRFTIGKYRVLERLGSGGMGSVFLCEHKFMRCRRAVKVLPTAKAADPSSLERFYREGRAVAAVDHPNLVHAYDIDQDENLHFIVMEYVDGPSLQDIVRRSGPITVERACHYISQAAQGLHRANMAGLVHRDIKPGNVLVDREGVVKILDMGLARFFNDEEDMLTRKYDENVLGTADYLAPEQADDSHTVDIRADIYSLGGTFYFLLTGRTPFGEGTVPQKLMWHRTRQPKPINSYRGDVAAEVQTIIDKMMAKEPEQRYQTPSEISAALTTWTQGPVPPPLENEMPRLSPAVSGAAAGSDDPGSGVAKKSWLVAGAAAEPAPTIVAKGAFSPYGKPGDGSRANPAAPLSPRPNRGTKLPASTKPPSSPRLAPALTSEEPWAAVGSDTANPSAKGDTPPQVPAKSRTVSPIRWGLPSTISPRVLMLASGGMLLLMVLLAVSVVAVVMGVRGRADTRQTLSVGRNGAFNTVAAALAKAKSGDRVVLLDREHREALTWAGGDLVDVQIQSADGIAVVWLPPTGGGEIDALLQLNNAKGFHIKDIRFSGEHRVRDLLRFTGICPGLHVENATLDGFNQAAIVVANCTGTQGSPVLLTGLTTSTGGKSADTAILFDAGPVQPPTNEHIKVSSNCRLDGSFGHGPIWFKKERSSTVIVP
ncbi:MAG TPA: protein kinase [Gemmataceae bacterium]|nr:protein kinase [Gemmataceae bacterium]